MPLSVDTATIEMCLIACCSLLALSPLYYQLFHFHVFGLGFMTSMAFILCIGEERERDKQCLHAHK